MNHINSKTLNRWLDKTARDGILIAPREIDGILLYKPVPTIKDIVWNYIRPTLSIKEAFFPSTERILTIEKDDSNFLLREVLPDQKRILFGVRPCDARGIVALDALFVDTEPKDLNYAKRRENSIIIGVGCNQMGNTCFCDRTGSGPEDPTGCDLFLTRSEKGLEVLILTEKGLRIAKEDWNLTSAEIAQPIIPDYSSSELPDMGAWPPQFNDKYWEDMSERCLSCRICAYVCPTCRCFDVRDESIPSNDGVPQYERVRCWDSCAGNTYRRIAGGHNPRSEKSQRLRNRFFCKFYYFPEQYGPTACTGCGRCIDLCPVNIDVTEVMSHIVECTHS